MKKQNIGNLRAFRLVAVAGGIASTVIMLSGGTAFANDTVTIAASHKGNFSTAIALLGDKQGYFKDEGIDLKIVWTAGGSDAQTALISGAVNIATNTGTLGVLSAYAKGAPIRIIASAMTGSGGLYWYVPADSPLKSFKQADGKTMAFSRPGSSTNLVASALKKHFDVDVKLVPTGSPTATLTQVMSGQIDIGWASPPVGIAKVQKGEIRILVRGDDAPDIKKQSIRVDAVNANWLKSHRDVAKRFMKALWKSHEYAFTEQGMKDYSKFSGIPLDIVEEITKFAPLKSYRFAPIGSLDQTMKEAVQTKRLKKPLTEEQVKELVQIVWQPDIDWSKWSKKHGADQKAGK